MLFRAETLDRIASGEITLAFRRQRRPTVKAGGTLLTRIGQLAIHAVDEIPESAITEADVLAAGFETKEALLAILKPEGALFRIRFSVLGADPRLALRDQDALVPAEVDSLRAKLAAIDARLPAPWCLPVLAAIRDHPGLRSPDLPKPFAEPLPVFKARVRRLKALGLTESLEVGYRLSLRGQALLFALRDDREPQHA